MYNVPNDPFNWMYFFTIFFIGIIIVVILREIIGKGA